MNNDLLIIIQSRVARMAVGPSTVRGKGNTGVAKAARDYLRQVDLSKFGTVQLKRFNRALESETDSLKLAFPAGARHWGIARKVLNIFLRDCAYNRFLSDKYRLWKAEELFEIPLDSITAKHLKKVAGRGVLDPWPGVKNVDYSLSESYQAVAWDEAHRQGFARLHLDALWWAHARNIL